MRLASFIASGVLVLAAASSCGVGVASPLEHETQAFDFTVSAVVNPDQPEAGRRVTLSIEVSSDNSEPVVTDVLVRVVSDDQQLLFEQRWDEINFDRVDVYSMTQGFNPVTVHAKSYRLELQVRRHDTGELLFENPEVTRLVFKTVSPK